MTQTDNTTTVSIRIPVALQTQLEELAQASGRDQSYLAVAALEDYLRREAWQIAAIRRGLDAAKGGEFADEDKVRRHFARLGVALED
ncbi:MAG: CopG family transcriptional regulator [Pseudomonadota bacterium]|nr:CopG family transcriptional regulator [Pseudomonadota bacterium]